MKSAKILTEGQLVKTMSDAKTSGKKIQEKVGWEKRQFASDFWFLSYQILTSLYPYKESKEKKLNWVAIFLELLRDGLL